MQNYKLNENVKKGKELLRGFGGRAWELGNGLLASAHEVKTKATDPEMLRYVGLFCLRTMSLLPL